MNYTFPVTRTTTPKEKPDQKALGFGKVYTDHMFLMMKDRAGTTDASFRMHRFSWIRHQPHCTTPR